MLKLRLFTLPNCAKCSQAKKMVERLAKERADIRVDVMDMSDTENYITALQLQIASAPSFVLDDTPICVGELPSYEELKRKIAEHEKRRG